MYHGDSSPQDQAADAAMKALYQQLDDHDLDADTPFNTAAGHRDLTDRIQVELSRVPQSAHVSREPERLLRSAHGTAGHGQGSRHDSEPEALSMGALAVKTIKEPAQALRRARLHGDPRERVAALFDPGTLELLPIFEDEQWGGRRPRPDSWPERWPSPPTHRSRAARWAPRAAPRSSRPTPRPSRAVSRSWACGTPAGPGWPRAWPACTPWAPCSPR